MKKFYHSAWLFLCLLLGTQVSAQFTYDGQGPLNFSSGVFQYTGTSAATVGFTDFHLYNAGGLGNTWSGVYTIPFAFDFYGVPATHFIVSKNFLLSFDTTAKNTAVNSLLADNSALPNANLPDRTICYNWDNFANGTATLGTNDDIEIGLFGTAPNRQLIIRNFSYLTGGNAFSYTYLVLEETTNKIFVIDWQNGTLNAGSRTIGTQLNSTTASSIAGSPNITALVTGTAQADLKYYELTPRLLLSNNIGVSDILSPAVPFALGNQNVQVRLNNFGTNAVSSATINWSVNGVTQTPFSFGGTLAVDADTVLNIGSFNFSANSDISAWSTLPNGVADTDPLSDTASISLKLPLSGSYTINALQAASATNFESFSSFTDYVNLNGVSGPLTVNVVTGSGPYLEQAIFGTIVGASPVNSIQINGNGNTLSFAPTATDKRIVGFNGSKYISLKNLTIVGTDLTNGFGIHFTNSSSHIEIDSCTIDLSTVTSTSSLNSAGILSSGDITSPTSIGVNANNITISNSTLLGGTGAGMYYGIRFNGNSTTSQDSSIRIINNTIADFYNSGIFLADIKNSIVQGNDIHRMSKVLVTTFAGITTSGSSQNDTINANSIHDSHGAASSLTGTSYGLFSTSNDAPSLAPVIWVNNIIYNLNSNGIIYGIYSLGSDNQQYVHNTISLDDAAATAGTTRGFYQLTAATGVVFQNNLISISRGGSGVKHGIHFGTAASTILSNYNNVFLNSAGTGAQHYGFSTTNQTTLADWQILNFGANSITVDPIFTNSSSDLTPGNPAMNNLGANLSVPTDYFGNSRGTNPDMGAIEFAPPACISVSSLSVDSLAIDAAKVTWFENGTSTQWQIEYGITGFTNGTGMKSIVNVDTFAIITGLNSNTAYDFYVRSICAVGDTSTWSSASSFVTLFQPCAPTAVATLPFFEGWENATDTVNGPSDITCNAGYTWHLLSSDPTGRARYGTAAVLTSSGTGAITLDKDPSGIDTKNDLILTLDLTAYTSNNDLELSFDFAHHGEENQVNDSVWVRGADTSSWVGIYNLFANRGTIGVYNNVGPIDIDLALAAAGQNVSSTFQVRFGQEDNFPATSPTVSDGFSFDNIRVQLTPPPYYAVGSINKVDTNGVSDSLNVVCFTSGTVAGVDLDGNVGISFTIIDQSSTTPEGISIFNFVDVSNYVVNEGDSIMVRGVVGQFNGLTQLVVDSIMIISTGSALPPHTLVTTLDESTESQLIRMENLTVTNVTTGTSINVSLFDGVNTFIMRVDGDTDVLDSLTFTAGDRICSVNGIGGQFDSSNPFTSGYQIFPMRYTDVVFAPSVDLGPDTIVCDTTGFMLDAGMFASYMWSTGDTTRTITPTAATTQYIVTIMDMNGCSATDTVTVTVNICTPPQPPYYAIGTINKEDAVTGVADSLLVNCFTSGTVAGVDLDGNNGISFTIIDQSSNTPEGISIFNFADVSNYVVNEGDSIMVRGVVGQFNGLTQLVVDSIMIISTGASLPAHTLVTALDETTESQLIRMENLIVTNVPTGTSINIDLFDGTNTFTMRVDADTDVLDSLTFTVGDRICSVNGIGGQFDSSNPFTSGYQIFPMRYTDVVFAPSVDLGPDTIVCDTSGFMLDAGTFASYMWNTGDTTQMITPNDTVSQYIVTVMDANGCTGTDTVNVTVTICVGINEVAENNAIISFFPNPNNGQFKLEVKNVTALNSTIEVVNINGQIVFAENLNINGSLSKDINLNVEKGLYFVRLVNDNGVKVEKLIIK